MDRNDRIALRDMVSKDDTIDMIIVHHTNGGNDFFSGRWGAEQCEREHVANVCRDIANQLDEIPRRTRSDKGGHTNCPDGISKTACPR